MKTEYWSFLFAVAICCLLFLDAVAQKPPLPLEAENSWASLGGIKLSPDGNYVYYLIRNPTPGVKQQTILQSTRNNWQKQFSNLGDSWSSRFTANSQLLISKTTTDSLALIQLVKDQIKYIPGVAAFTVCAGENILLYELKNQNKSLIWLNLVSGKEQRFDGVDAWRASDEGRDLVLTRGGKLEWIDTHTGKAVCFWNNDVPVQLVLDGVHRQLVFVSHSNSEKSQKTSIWHYKWPEQEPKEVFTSSDLDDTSIIMSPNPVACFSAKGDRLLLKLQEHTYKLPPAKGVAVDIWSYTDSILQSEQLNQISPKNIFGGPKRFSGMVHLDSGKFLRLTYQGDSDYFEPHELDGEYLSVYHPGLGSGMDWNWNRKTKPGDYLLSLETGKRMLMEFNIKRPYKPGFPILSLKQRYVVYFDPIERGYYSYEIATGTIRLLTAGINAIWTRTEEEYPRGSVFGFGYIGWLPDDAGILVYDRYDIWRLDPKGIERPVNLTNGYGMRNRIRFWALVKKSQYAVTEKETVVFAFDEKNRQQGFYKASLSKSADPVLLSMGDHYYDEPDANKYVEMSKDRQTVVLTRETGGASRNYFVTNDFKNFRQLSTIAPEKSYNWVRPRLVHYTDSTGDPLQAIVYTPENFDSTRKYPVIFYYYEELSNKLNSALKPGPSSGALNIAYFVSRGYVVCTPDIHYVIGDPGRSALKCVMAAVNRMSQFPWVDITKMGIQGHSYGGFETNYIVTHTNIFAAACSAAGISDCISNYNTVSHDMRSRQYFYENGQMRGGASLWSDPSVFLRNSPIFWADKVTTPVLLMHNQEDNMVPFPQGLAMFNALRRLGKRAWMCQYDGQGHGVYDEAGIDWTIRMEQFFDHYLKNKPAPMWMLKGILATQKGRDAGLELDSTGATPGPGLGYEHANP
jgi:dipeptidyl aminopeptidase/acylaminoacyl peptidase